MGVHLSDNIPAKPKGTELDRIRTDASGIGNALAQGFQNVVNGIGDALRGIFSAGGIFSKIGRAGQEFRDGQEDLKNRQDLLSPLLDYGSAYLPTSQTGKGKLRLNQQLGPARGVRILRDGGMQLLDKGLWDIRLHLTISWVVILSDGVAITLRVYSPSGNLYSQQTSQQKTSATHSHTIVMSVVVPAPNYKVEVWVDDLAGTREIPQGPRWSRLVAQHISREVDGGWNRGNENSSSLSQQS